MERFEHILARRLAGPTGLEESELVPLIGQPPKPEMGDYALACFALSKRLRKDPKKIAEELAASLDLVGTPFAQAAAAGPYLNFRLDGQALARTVLEAIGAEAGRYGFSEQGAGKTVIVDYSSPNIAKPFHIGHLRSTVIGAALHRIYRALGYNAVGINHLGDWGTQFGMVMAAFDQDGDESALTADPIGYSLKLYVDYNKKCEAEPEARDTAKAWFKRLEDGDEEAVRLWRRFRDLSLQKFEKIYRRLGASFDHYAGESFYNDRMESALQEAEKAGVLEKGGDGAWLIRLDDFGMPPFILRKSDGATLYATREIAAALYRWETFAPELLLYVVGTPQELHFRQYVQSLRLMGRTWADRIVHVKFGHVHGMSTRKGEVVLLEDVLDEAAGKAARKIEENLAAGRLDPDLDRAAVAEAVGIGAIVAADLKHRRERDVSFDWDTVLQFDGETGPYLQYSYARIQGILRKSGQAVPPAADYALLTEPETRALIRALADFGAVVEKAAAECEPSLITTYLFELTKAWNVFYTHHRVLGSGGEVEKARILLVDRLRQALHNGLELLGIPILDRM